jgi:hypothetical protein
VVVLVEVGQAMVLLEALEVDHNQTDHHLEQERQDKEIMEACLRWRKPSRPAAVLELAEVEQEVPAVTGMGPSAAQQSAAGAVLVFHGQEIAQPMLVAVAVADRYPEVILEATEEVVLVATEPTHHQILVVSQELMRPQALVVEVEAEETFLRLDQEALVQMELSFYATHFHNFYSLHYAFTKNNI